MNIDKSPQKIQTMFDKIAQKYDFMNNIISFGTDKIIKFNCIKLLNIKPNAKVLDICTGTGDVAGFVKGLYPSTEVIGLDFSENMLEIAKAKNPNIEFIKGDCTNLPFTENTFDIITICYGLRNIENRSKAIGEMHRVLKPNGKLMHLDFGEKTFAGKIFEKAVPFLAKIFNCNKKSYKYLVNSKQDFPTPENLIKEFTNFRLEKRQDFLFKSISCQIFIK